MIEIMDTTLRDGEQTSGVSLSGREKAGIARLLLQQVGVDRIEIASARVSDGEMAAAKMVCDWAAAEGFIDRVEILGFVDGGRSLDWIAEAGGRVINLLCKGSEKHCREQLGKTPEEHLSDIKANIALATARGIKVNVYLEDWSNGMIHSPAYVYAMTEGLRDERIERIMLPDTLGILNPWNCGEFCADMVARFPWAHFDFHAHNDYDLATANVAAAARAGIKGMHTTVNGLGERAGNAPLASVVAVLHDQLKLRTRVDEARMTKVSRLVENYTGIHIPPNKPVVGENVFTQCAGVHADGDSKNNLYFNDLIPERFGRVREYALGKTSGKANIKKNLEALGIELDEASMRKVTERIIELGDKKEAVTTEDLPYIIADVLKGEAVEPKVKILGYHLSLAQGLKPVATVKMEVGGKVWEETSAGDGQYDAFMKAVRRIYKTHLSREFPMLTNYTVSIPPGGRTDAFVQTIITW
ncbi:MAG: 2-isopropylmalate synthase, partial [Rikenellaceae bacterium]|nr:2-isopropylmalate synthase [Rikenellaceae bacterium]